MLRTACEIPNPSAAAPDWLFGLSGAESTRATAPGAAGSGGGSVGTRGSDSDMGDGAGSVTER
jgi:hypothetical protein